MLSLYAIYPQTEHSWVIRCQTSLHATQPSLFNLHFPSPSLICLNEKEDKLSLMRQRAIFEGDPSLVPEITQSLSFRATWEKKLLHALDTK